MVRKFRHQRTIGIIGATPDSQAFVLEANKLGFGTYLFVKSEEEVQHVYGADKVFVGELNQEYIRENFLMESDLLVYFDESVNASDLVDIQKMIIAPQGDDLLSIVQDRVLQKAYLESLSMNIAPYVTIVKPEDITEGIRSIGYPAVLKPNQISPDSKEKSYFIYEESDIEDAVSLLKNGTCVLESWIVSDRLLSISAVRANNGELKLFPIIEREYRNERLFNSHVPHDLNSEWIEEMERVAQVIFRNLEFRGVASIDFLVTPADALYIGSLHAYPNILTRYSAYSCSISATEAHLRAVTSLPLPLNIEINPSHLFIPFYMEQIDVMNELITIYPEWNFVFYPLVKTDYTPTEQPIGHITVETEDHKRILERLKDKGF